MYIMMPLERVCPVHGTRSYAQNTVRVRVRMPTCTGECVCPCQSVPWGGRYRPECVYVHIWMCMPVTSSNAYARYTFECICPVHVRMRMPGTRFNVYARCTFECACSVLIRMCMPTCTGECEFPCQCGPLGGRHRPECVCPIYSECGTESNLYARYTSEGSVQVGMCMPDPNGGGYWTGGEKVVRDVKGALCGVGQVRGARPLAPGPLCRP